MTRPIILPHKVTTATAYQYLTRSTAASANTSTINTTLSNSSPATVESVARPLLEEEEVERRAEAAEALRAAVQYKPKWKRVDCPSCRMPCWLDGKDATQDRCKLCRMDASRVKRCAVCFENALPVNNMHKCAVDVCIHCATAHCNVALDDGAWNLSCAGCSRELTEKEVKVIGFTLSRRLQEVRDASRQKHLVDLFDRAPDLLEWAQAGNAQVCPNCSKLVQKSSGCAHMTCKCGKEFCYGCGGAYPCTNHCQRAGTPKLNFDMASLVEYQRARREAVLFGNRCADSVLSLLPSDVVHKIIREVDGTKSRCG